jgi:hypothetical protein
MRTPGIYRWREGLILLGVPVNVSLGWAAGQMGSGPLGDGRWLLDWGIGAFYGVVVLLPLGWYRSQSLVRSVAAVAISIFAWHWAAKLAAEGYPLSYEQPLAFLTRSTVSGFFGAVVTGGTSLARPCFPGWERRLPIAGIVGGICGLQMGLLCLWNFELGFWLGIVGWQLAVTAVYLYATAPQHAGKPQFWPAPPQLV